MTTCSPISPGSQAGHLRHGQTFDTAYSLLVSELDQAIDEYRRTLRVSAREAVIDAIERFVHELQLVPAWFAEFERRAALVESACQENSPYAATREKALASFAGNPPAKSRIGLAMAQLRRASTAHPYFLSQVVEVRKSIESIRSDPSFDLSPAARQAFADWERECLIVQREAERLEVDGCWFLRFTYGANETENADGSRKVKEFLRTEPGGASLESIRFAATAITGWTRELGAARSGQVDTEVHLDEVSCQIGDEQPQEAQPFAGGTMFFFEDRVELCGVDICSGSRCKPRREILELLSRKHQDGAPFPYSGEELKAALVAKKIEIDPAGAIRDLRRQISSRLPVYSFGKDDVIRSRDSGYRLDSRIHVQFDNRPHTEAITDRDHAGDVPNVRNDDVRNDDVPDGAACSAAEERQAWILDQLSEEVRLKSPTVAKHFNCSKKTAERDLAALRRQGKIEHVGSARTGHYRVLPPSSAD